MKAIDISRDNRSLSQGVTKACTVVGAIGLAVGVAGGLMMEGGASRVLHAWLLNFSFYLSIALGALFFVMLQHLTRAGWSVVLRRIAEALAHTMPLFVVLSLPILFDVVVTHHLLPWTDPDFVARHELVQKKTSYLNIPFFLLRYGAYFVIWILLSSYLFKRSVEQDESGDPALTHRMHNLSAPGMILFALSATFFAFDLLMSLDPEWFSTIFGVYFFAGGIVAFFALLPILVYAIQRSGRIRHAVTVEHYHDMGKLIFAFVVFWAYIAFSQYMLIWYANIPEETRWYEIRQQAPWLNLSLFLLAGHFIIPFLALVSRHPKRRPGILVVAACWVLGMHWFDIFWLVMPREGVTVMPLGIPEIGLAVGMGGLFLGMAAWRLKGRSLIPEKDPRLAESVSFENA